MGCGSGILALAMLAAASMQFSSIRNNASGNMATQASMLAKAQMEVLKNTSDNIGDINRIILFYGHHKSRKYGLH